MLHRKKRFGVLVVVLVAIAAGGASFALAGSANRPEGGDGAEASNTLTQTTCGSQIHSFVRTENAQSNTNSTAFAQLPGASVSVNVPSGKTRCIKVLFTAETGCGASGTAQDFCFVRALDNGVEMNPQGGGQQIIDSANVFTQAHAFEWVQRVGAGTHTITLEWRVSSSSTPFFIDDWTFDVQVMT